MNSETLERHILQGSPEATVDIEDNGSVWVQIGSELMNTERLSEIVAFVEAHGQVSVVIRDEA